LKIANEKLQELLSWKMRTKAQNPVIKMYFTEIYEE